MVLRTAIGAAHGSQWQQRTQAGRTTALKDIIGVALLAVAAAAIGRSECHL